MVGAAYVAASYIYRLQVATIQYVVDAEIKTIGIVCYDGSERTVGVRVAQSAAFDGAVGIAPGHVIEVAYKYHIVALTRQEVFYTLCLLRTCDECIG